jgi:hypothetical protein
MASPSRAEIDSFKLLHADKGDLELRAIALGNIEKINALPSSSSPSMVAQAQLWLAETTACNEIIERRKKDKEAKQNALETWQLTIENKAESNILNLPAASSANGQLIAAILEDEDGLTAEEITGWCEELTLLGLEECKKLLDQLVAEDILELGKDQKYYLLNICTPSLFPSDAGLESWMQRHFKRHPELETYTAKLIIAVIHFYFRFLKEAFTKEDLVERIQNISTKDLKVLIADYPFVVGIGSVSAALENASILTTLRQLSRYRMISYTTINGYNFYYFRMLGEK